MKNFIEYMAFVAHGSGRKVTICASVLAVLVLLALLFQLVHFAEHIAQAGAWLGGFRSAPYMTGVGHYLMGLLGTGFFPDASMKFQMMMGNEFLHLIGNTIYLAGTLGLLYFVRNRFSIAAACIQSLHFVEHLSLTFSAWFTGTPIGMSTVYGLPMATENLVTFRVWWHFFMNALPTTLSIIAVYMLYKAYCNKYKK